MVQASKFLLDRRANFFVWSKKEKIEKKKAFKHNFFPRLRQIIGRTNNYFSRFYLDLNSDLGTLDA